MEGRTRAFRFGKLLATGQVAGGIGARVDCTKAEGTRGREYESTRIRELRIIAAEMEQPERTINTCWLLEWLE